MNVVPKIFDLIENLPAIVINHWIVFAVIGFAILHMYKKEIKRFSRKLIKLMYVAQGSIISLGILRDIVRMLDK